jgi:hypothetical protein
LATLPFSCSLIAFTIYVSEDFVFFKVDIFSSFELLFGSIFWGSLQAQHKSQSENLNFNISTKLHLIT